MFTHTHARAALPSGGLGVLVAVGVFLMVVAIIGWAGVKFNYKMGGRYVLGVYATTLIILMIMEFSAAIVLVNFTGRLGNWVSHRAHCCVSNAEVLNIIRKWG